MTALLSTTNYYYGNSTWGDLLTSYNNLPITYDNIGNVLSDGTWHYTWKYGRQLATMYSGGTTWTFTYDANGMRIGRAPNNGAAYTYVYNGSHLSRMTYGSNTLIFAYDASGNPMTVKFNGSTYYYVTNLQGDVVTILNSSGVAVVQYTYDAWGKVLTTTGSMASSLGQINPLRYRGYVYDMETGLYYLQSRYYNPEIGRFISADNYPSTGQGLTGNNMFAYCGNNPVSRNDEGGEFWHIVIGAAIGAVANFAISVASQVISGAEEIDWDKAVVSAGVGLITGGLSAMGVPAGVLIGVNAGLSAAESVYGDISDNMRGKANYSVGDIVAHATINAGVSALFTAAGVSSDDVNLNALYKSSRTAKKALKVKGLAPAVKKGLKRTASAYSKELGRFTVDCAVDALVVSPITTFSSWYANAHYNIFT